MINYKKTNNLVGWITFAIAAFVYVSTIEPTASFWDCGEYILSCFKLEVGHPPGAPLFLLLGRFFTLFAGGDVTKAAMWVNIMSALSSAFTILFLFWSITALGRRLLSVNGELNAGKMWAIMGSGFVGAMAYTFSDSFWFSAVEGEVYAMSSLCTAIVFWAILKWEQVAEQPFANRWLLFIAYIFGLSIGVHLLNLLAIPAIVFVYYFKKYKPSTKGMIIAFIVSICLLGGIQNVIVPQVVNLSAKFDLFFVNSIGLPFNYGTIIYFLLLLSGIVFGIRYAVKNNRPGLHTAILSFAILLIGYSTFLMLVIRSNANTPMDQNNPENAVNLLSYLKREQYGDWPILYGQYYNSPIDGEKPYSDGDPIYRQNKATGKYYVYDDRKNTKYNFDKRFCTPFPRMWESNEQSHARAYQVWGDVKGEAIQYNNPYSGKTETIIKPTFFENMKFMFTYQINHMYLRYLMWNFAGRQNDIQGHGIEYSSRIEGNWISGIPFIDELRLGSQSQLPESVTHNKANNKFYFFPLILGILGLLYQYKKSNGDFIVVLLLFIFTGLAIVFYLNQYPYQPRERDYAYTGSFYAFAIWIGLGTLGIFEALKKINNEQLRAGAVTALCVLLVPGIMAQQGWDDHDRSHRYTARDYASDYLNSCAKNAILFTNGDNDTFPLWYAQEVEGIRTDVRVANLSLAGTDWYIQQLCRKAYDSDPIPHTLTTEQYQDSKREMIPVRERADLKGFQDLKKIIGFIGREDDAAKVQYGDEARNYLPTKKLRIPVDSAKVVNNGTVSLKDTGYIPRVIEWTINKTYLTRSDIMMLDIIATSNWERPIYFAITTGSDSYLNLEPYFRLEGLTYRLVPLSPDPRKPLRIATDIMYDNMMNKFKWGGLDKHEVYMDENNMRMALTMRMQMITLANALVDENKKTKAKEVLNRCLEVLPEKNVPFFYEPYDYNYYLISAFYRVDEFKTANELASRFIEILDGDMQYCLSLSAKDRNAMMRDVYKKTDILMRVIDLAKKENQTDFVKKAETILSKYQAYMNQES